MKGDAFKAFGVIACLCVSVSSISAQRIDTVLLRHRVDSAYSLLNNDETRHAMVLATSILRQSQGRYYYATLNSLQIIGESYYRRGVPDSATYFYHLALQSSRDANDPRENANNYTSLATLLNDSGERDSALYYYQLAISTFQNIRDSFALCDALLRYGNVHNTMGNHDLAITAYMHSMRICEASGREEYIAYNNGSIASIHDKQGNYVKAEEYFLKALSQFKRLSDLYGQAGILNNLGILYKNMKAYEKSLDAYTQSLALADSINFNRGRLSAYTNLGILTTQMGYFERALQYCQRGLELARDLQAKESIADNLNWLARAQLGLSDLENALQNGSEALRLGIEVQSLEKQRDAYQTLSEIYQAQGAYDLSLEHFKAYTQVKDSLFNIDKSKQINELQTIYETEKKDKEILILGKNAEIDRMRKTRLWLAFVLSLLAGVLLVYAQWLRRVRDNKIHAQQKELEIQRRKTSELEKDKISRELDFKKQELAAKALQLARKNEFLRSLTGQVDGLRTIAQSDIDDSARKISRQIRMDIESEEDWEQFLSSFREVHRDFLEKLQDGYPEITKSELRLACLMKMNLSAKELAALLNITPDGIKKARYRLRKKMNLGSDVDIQEFLLAFPR